MVETNYQAIEDKIVAAIEDGLKEGFVLAPFYGRLGNNCCAIGMVSRDIEPYQDGQRGIVDTTAERLGIGIGETFNIAHGFDSGLNPTDDPYVAIGVRIHKRYNQTPATAVDAT